MLIARALRVALATVCLLGLIATVGGCEGSFNFDFGFVSGEASEDFTFSRSLDDYGTMRVTTNLGKIDISVDETLTEAQINGTITARGSTDAEAEELLDDVDIIIVPDAADETVLVVRAARALDGWIKVDFEIVLPAGIDLDLSTDTGRIDVEGNSGQVNAETDTGSVDVTDNNGDVFVQTDTGSVDVIDISGNVEVLTDTGSIFVRTTLPEDGTIDLESTGAGGIDIQVPLSTAAALDLRTDFGTVEADLNGFTITNLQTSINSLQAVLNGGGATIRARAEFGGIDFDSF